MICDKCEKEAEESSMNLHLDEKDHMIENGLEFEVFGYYSGFFDDMNDNSILIKLCHDCSKEIWDSIPKLKNSGKASHSTIGNVKCCNYWWGIEEDDLGDKWLVTGSGVKSSL